MKGRFVRMFVAAAWCAAALPATAITVNSTADGALAALAGNATCDLREAIQAVNTGATVGQCVYDGPAITLAASLAGQTIVLATDDSGVCAFSFFRLSLCRSATLAAAAGQVTLDFQGHSGLMMSPVQDANAKIAVSLSGLNFTGAAWGALWVTPNPTTVGGTPNYSVDLTLDAVSVTGNANTVYGGGLYFDGGGNPAGRGALVIRRSLFAGNSASFAGGAIYAAAPSSISISNTTFDGNRTDADGGALSTGVWATTAALDHLTVTGNSSTQTTGGLSLAGATTTLTNSIVSGNTAASGDPDLNGSITTLSHNVVGTPAVPLASWLGPLADNGGPTQTRALLLVAGNPALNAGDNAYGSAGDDQRGTGFPRTVGATTDIGAFEYQAVVAASTTYPELGTAPFGRAAQVHVVASNAGGGTQGLTGQVVVTVTTGPQTGATCTAPLTVQTGSTYSEGWCDLPIGTYPVGGYTMTATYGGDANYAPSIGTGPLTIVPQEILPRVAAPEALPHPPDTPAVLLAGASYGFSYWDLYFAYGSGPVVTPPTGSFTVTTDEGVSCTLPIQPVAGSCPLHFDAPGRHGYTVSYAGDGGYALYVTEGQQVVDVAPAAAATLTPVPTLSEWALLLLTTVLALAGVHLARDRARALPRGDG